MLVSTTCTRPREPGPIFEANCWAHARHNFFDIARLKKAPIAIEAVNRIDAPFVIEREINGALLMGACACATSEAALSSSTRDMTASQRAKLSAKNELAKVIDYCLRCWSTLTRFLDDGRLCMTNNAAERSMRCVAVGRKNWTFACSDRGDERAAAIYTLIETERSTESIRVPGWPMCSLRCRIIRSTGLPISCSGTGIRPFPEPKPPEALLRRRSPAIRSKQA
jgi:transposase